MKKFLVLTRVQLRALLSTLRIGGSRKRAASGWGALALAAGLCLYLSGFYSFALGGQLAALGALDLLLLMMPAAAVAAGVLFTALAAQAVVFSGRDSDLLLALPVPALTVLLSKTAALYVENLVFCLFFVLPAGAARWWFGGGGGAAFALRMVLGTVFLALVPTVLALGIGFLLGWLGARLGSRRWINLALCVLTAGVVLLLVLRLNGAVSALMAGELGIDSDVPFWALPFRFFQEGVCGSWGKLALFGLGALALLLGAAAVLAGRYRQVLTGLKARRRGGSLRLDRVQAAGPRRAVLRKEAARYFGTPIYLMNTGLGLILLPAAGIAAVVMKGRLQGLLAQMGGIPVPVLAAGTVLLCLSTAAVTGSSISLEGKTLWILRGAPLPAGEILEVKAAFQVLITAPCLLVGGAGIAWGLDLGWAMGAVLVLAGLAFSGFCALFGLLVNLCFPRLDAISDAAVVKQSAAAMISTFAAMAAAAACTLAAWGLTALVSPEAAWGFLSLVLLALCAALDRWLATQGAKRFLEL